METTIFDLLDTVFDRTRVNLGWAPKVNVYEQDNEYHIDVFYPGKTREDFTIEVKNQNGKDVILLTSNFKKDKEKDGKDYLIKEFEDIEFVRKFILPPNADKKKISAKYDAGILKAVIPKDVKKEKESNFKVNIE